MWRQRLAPYLVSLLDGDSLLNGDSRRMMELRVYVLTFYKPLHNYNFKYRKLLVALLASSPKYQSSFKHFPLSSKRALPFSGVFLLSDQATNSKFVIQ